MNWEFQLSGWFQTLPDGGFRQAARIGDWKAVRYGVDSPIELYDLSEDISESHDLSDEHPEIVRKAITTCSKLPAPKRPAFHMVASFSTICRKIAIKPTQPNRLNDPRCGLGAKPLHQVAEP